MNSNSFKDFCYQYGNVFVTNNTISFDDENKIKTPRYTIYLPLINEGESHDYLVCLLNSTLNLFQLGEDRAENTVKNIISEIEKHSKKYLLNFNIHLSHNGKYAFQKEEYEINKRLLFEQIKNNELE